MEVFEAVKKRRSIRYFSTDPIPQESIKQLKEAIKFAPSAGNKQSRFFHFVYSAEIREKIKVAANNQKFVAQAPLVVVGSMNLKSIESYEDRGKSLYSIIDVATSIQNLMVVATSLGLGSCWVGSFDERKIAEILTLPAHLRPIALIPVGVPIYDPKAPERHEDKDIFLDVT